MAKPKLPRSFTDRLEYCSLTEEEKEEIRTRAYEQVDKEKKAREEERFMAAALNEARAADEPELQMEDIFIDLPGHAVRILIDGIEYLHGFSYTVNQPKAQTMRDIMQRCWNHEDEVGGANREWYKRPRNINLTRRNSSLTSRQILGG
jgi:hypothetical protein